MIYALGNHIVGREIELQKSGSLFLPMTRNKTVQIIAIGSAVEDILGRGDIVVVPMDYCTEFEIPGKGKFLSFIKCCILAVFRDE